MGFEDFAKAVQFGDEEPPARAPEQNGFDNFSRLVADTTALKKQYAAPQGDLATAAKSDAGGFLNWLASMDVTNPSNIPNAIKSGVPMALQVGATALAPESALMRILASGAAAIPGRAVSQGVNALQGQPTDLSPGSFAKDAGLNMLFQGGAEAGGPAVSSVLGKSAAATASKAAETGAAENIAQAETQAQLTQANKRADIALSVEDKAKDLETARAGKIADITKGTEEQYQAALADQQTKTADLVAKAEQDHAKMMEGLASKKATAEEAVNREVLKHSDTALADLTDEQVEKAVSEGLGPKAVIQRPVTIESLTAAVRPPQVATNDAVKGVFGNISGKFQDALEPYADLPVQSSLRGAAKIIKDDIAANGEARLSPAMDALMKRATGSDIAAAKVRGATETDAQKIVDNLRRAGNNQAADDLAMKFGMGAANKGDTVGRMMGYRSQFVDQLHSKRAIDRRAAASMIDAIDGDVAKVTPPELETQLSALRDEWHTAKSTLSDTFRNRLFRASSPEQVAEVIYTGAKTGKNMGHRAELLVNQMKAEAPEQLPVLSRAFTSMLTNSKDVAGDIQKMPPGLFKALYPGTGFDKPEGWVQAIRGQQSAEKILSEPELMARFNSAVQTGMASLGSKAKKDALAAAERSLANAPNVQAMVQEALKDAPPTPDLGAMLNKSLQKAPPAPDRGAMLDKALRREPTPQEAGKLATLGMQSPAQAGEVAGMEAMRKPFLGRFQNYMAHRLEFDIGLALLSGGAGLLAHHPMAAATGLTYLAGSRAMGAALANPKIGRMYYNFITSKTVEQMGIWAGRMAAAGLSQASKSD